MSVAVAIKNAVRWAALGLTLVTFCPLANAQQPSPAALASAKELISITGATTLFGPLIAGVVEQAKLFRDMQAQAIPLNVQYWAEHLEEIVPRYKAMIGE